MDSTTNLFSAEFDNFAAEYFKFKTAVELRFTTEFERFQKTFDNRLKEEVQQTEAQVVARVESLINDLEESVEEKLNTMQEKSVSANFTPQFQFLYDNNLAHLSS